MELIFSLGFPIIVGTIAVIAIGFVIARLYKRSSKDVAYVRTGLGGQKVVLDGGSIVLPVFQSIAWVNLKTLRLEVQRKEVDAMITKDRMRVDIGVEFYVRVKPDAQSIALAAQTLGDRTNNAEQLRELIEAKFVDALRSVAATMMLADLQEKRSEFVKSVQETVATDLLLNGLELESASLTRLDQTDTKYFNPSNAFDAEGLAALARITEAKRQERNFTVRAAEVAIAQQDLEATQKKLEIERQKKESELSQQRDIVNKTALTRAETAQKEAEAQQAEAQARIATEQLVKTREAESRKIQEEARITAELAISQKNIEASRTAETLEIAKKRDIEIADQERSIAVANKSQQESQARAEAEKARAAAVAAQEQVETARRVEIAEREKRTAVIAAQQEAEQQAAGITIAAHAEKDAALDRAEAIRVAAKAEAEAVTIKAEAQAKTYEVEAEGQRKINEAANAMSQNIIDFNVAKERLRAIPLALAEAVKPIEKIGDVKIIDMGGGMPGAVVAGGSGDGRIDSLVNQLMAYRANAPIIDQLLTEAGFGKGQPIGALLGGLKAPAGTSVTTMNGASVEEAPVKE
jgi:flotillin